MKSNLQTIIADKPIEWIDLSEFVQRGLQDVVYLRVEGNSFAPFICEGDLLIVERSFTPLNGDLIVAEINGGMTIKEFKLERNGLSLVTYKETPKPNKLKNEKVFGVVVYITHKIRRFEMSRRDF